MKQDERRADSVLRRALADPAGTLFLFGVSALLALGVVGVPLAVLGWFRPWLVLPIAVAVWLAASAVGLKITPGSRSRRETTASAIGAHLVLGFTIFAALHSGENLWVDRDPGVYNVTGKWLAAHGSLLYEPGLSSDVIAALPPRAWGSAGMYAATDGVAYFQFAHLTGVVLATAQWMGGDALMLNTPAAMAGVALLGVFVLARRLTNGYAALLPLGAILMHPATLHFAKDAYSEWPALAFTMAALWVWLTPGHRLLAARHAAVGMLLGLVTMARIDGWLTVAAFLVGVAYVTLTRSDATPWNRVGWMLGGVALTGALALLDLSIRSPGYLLHLGRRVRPLLIATGLSALALAGAVGVRAVRPHLSTARLRRFVSTLAVLLVVTAALVALVFRPDLHGDDQPPLALGLVWFAWYQGYPLLLAMIGAIAWGAATFLRGVGDRRAVVISVLMAVALIYLWRPSISPDHVWAMRRFLPTVIPLGFISLGWAVHRLATTFDTMRTLIVALAGVPLVLGSVTMLRVGAPIATVRNQVGMVGYVDALCGALPSGAAVMFDGVSGLTLPVTVRSHCGVAAIRGVSTSWAEVLSASGLTPVAATSTRYCLPGESLGSFTLDITQVARTRAAPPTGPSSRRVTLHLTSIDPEPVSPRGESPAEVSAALELLVVVSERPTERVLIASLGEPGREARLEWLPNGQVVLTAATAGERALPIAYLRSGLSHVIGINASDDQVTATCAGVPVGSLSLGGEPVGDGVRLAPAGPGTPFVSIRTIQGEDG